jgi:hypothetical protein
MTRNIELKITLSVEEKKGGRKCSVIFIGEGDDPQLQKSIIYKKTDIRTV